MRDDANETFEIGLYNARVRALVEQGKRPRQLADDWADIRYIEVRASDEAAARRKITAKYPEAQGYVIVSFERVRF